MTPVPLPSLARLAAASQVEPATYLPYLGCGEAEIAAEVAEIPEWAQHITVAHVGPRLVGWLLADVGVERGRVWWLGPFVDPGSDWGQVAADLYARAEPRLPHGLGDEELAGDARHTALARFAEAHGFAPAPSSMLLRTLSGADVAAPHVRPLDPADHMPVATLHDQLFPGTHTPGRVLVAASTPTQLRWVIGTPPIAYIAVELQPEQGGYIDFVGVAEPHRRQGLGRRLVAYATRQLLARGAASVHLTVLTENVAAIGLYQGLGFVGERVVVPYRKPR